MCITCYISRKWRWRHSIFLNVLNTCLVSQTQPFQVRNLWSSHIRQLDIMTSPMITSTMNTISPMPLTSYGKIAWAPSAKHWTAIPEKADDVSFVVIIRGLGARRVLPLASLFQVQKSFWNTFMHGWSRITAFRNCNKTISENPETHLNHCCIERFWIIVTFISECYRTVIVSRTNLLSCYWYFVFIP